MRSGTPFVFFNDSGGARIQEGVDSLSGYGKVFYANTELSGLVPQISLICGPCAGGAVYSPALTDFIVQTRRAHMFITGPQVIKQVTGEAISADELGGADVQQARSGVVHFVAEDDQHAIEICQRLLSFLPSNNLENPPVVPGNYSLEPDFSLDEIIPDDPKRPYEIRDVITKVVDFGDFLEVHERFAESIVVGFGRIAGKSVGIVANQPQVFAGVLDIDSSDKASRFVRFCNAFNIPIVTFVDTPGFLPGVAQEHGGIIRHGAKLLFAYSAATVPLVTVILRKAYGGAYVAMCSRELGADRVFAWPTAEVAVMGAEGASEIVFKREIDAAEDKAAVRKELTDRYRSTFGTPYVAAARRLVDDIIEPNQTRLALARALESLSKKREFRPAKKHGLIPM
jgi:methylmalonyl-CoA carboxyltransferase large subunit